MIVLPLLILVDFRPTPPADDECSSSFSIAQLLAAPLWGRVSDRYGRRPAVSSDSARRPSPMWFSVWQAVCGCSFFPGGAGSRWKHRCCPGLRRRYRRAGRPCPSAWLALCSDLRGGDGVTCHRLLHYPIRPGRAGHGGCCALSYQCDFRVALVANRILKPTGPERRSADRFGTQPGSPYAAREPPSAACFGSMVSGCSRSRP